MTPVDKAAEPSVGEAVKATQNGSLPIGTVQDILDHATDVVEDVIEIPEWGYSVRVKSFTSDQDARIRQKMYDQKGDHVEVNWKRWDASKFIEGVIEPTFDGNQVEALMLKSGPGFRRVIRWLNEKSGITEEEVRQTEDAFQEQQKEHQD